MLPAQLPADDPTVYFRGEGAVEGVFAPLHAVRISPHDRGFVFGDGVYEVWRTYDGRAYRAAEHLARLRASLAAVRIAPGCADGLEAIAAELFARNGLADRSALFYVQVTRGAAPRTHAFPSAGVPPTLYAEVSPVGARRDAQARGAAVILAEDLRWRQCSVKALTLLPNVLARQQAQEAGATEAVLLRDGVVTEGTHTSVFAVVNGAVRTHPLDGGVLPGVTRGVVLGLCRALGVPAAEVALSRDELERAEEVFLTGTTTEVQPVTSLDGRAVAGGRPGPVTLRLLDAFREDVVRHCGPSPQPTAP